MRRRDFIKVVAGSAAWPLAAQAQQPASPVIGFLSARESTEAPQLLAAVRQGLKEQGFVEGQNVAIEYRFAGNQNDQLPTLATKRDVSDLSRKPAPDWCVTRSRRPFALAGC